ncbi:MAG: DUF4157 domain-containing protein [bacterium]
MAQSHPTISPEVAKTSSVAHPPISMPELAPEHEQCAASPFVQRAVSAAGGNNPHTPPSNFQLLLGHMQNSPSSRFGVMRQLQRSYGNSYVGNVIQAKFVINQPEDIYEQEADRVAEEVMRIPEPAPLKPVSGTSSIIQRECAVCASGGGLCPQCAEDEELTQRRPLASQITPLIQRQEMEEPEEEIFQAKEAAGATPTVSPTVENHISAMRGGGQPLPSSVRAFFEPQFGVDFSQVRVHTDAQAAESARAVNAKAFTLGRDMVFGVGNFAPESVAGRRLLAHELTHVIQQRASGGFIQRTVLRPSLSDLRTIAQGYIGDYHSAAIQGLLAFEGDIQSVEDFDWAAFWVAVGGNVIWATASFATGGTAFVISISGIAISTLATASAVTSAPNFRREALRRIDDTVTHINNQVDRVTQDVDAEAAIGNLDDNATRMLLLEHMVSDRRYIVETEGGLPNLNQPAVAAQIRETLLLEASQLTVATGKHGRGLFDPGPGYFLEEWEVNGSGLPLRIGYSSTSRLEPLSRWTFHSQHAGIVNVTTEISNINDYINDIYRNTYHTLIDPRRWPMRKIVQLKLPPISEVVGGPNPVTIFFDANNNQTGWTTFVFERILRDQGEIPAIFIPNLIDHFRMSTGGVLHRWVQLG